MTEDKNLTPFSIADILKSNDQGDGSDGDGGGNGGGGGGGDGNISGGRESGAGHRAKNNEALDMTNNKIRAHKQGETMIL